MLFGRRLVGKKGQGALEYLIILAGVLAIAVIVILVLRNVSNPAQQNAQINQAKFACAEEGIKITELGTTSDGGISSVYISYNGGKVEKCSSGSASSPEASCSFTLKDKSGTDHSHTITVNSSGCYYS